MEKDFIFLWKKLLQKHQWLKSKKLASVGEIDFRKAVLKCEINNKNRKYKIIIEDVKYQEIVEELVEKKVIYKNGNEIAKILIYFFEINFWNFIFIFY